MKKKFQLHENKDYEKERMGDVATDQDPTSRHSLGLNIK
jgi:hypothetical protein